MDGCLTGGFKCTFICCSGICDCRVTSPVDDNAALLSHQLKHTHKSSTVLEEKTKHEKAYTVLVISSSWLRLMDGFSDTGQVRTLQPCIKTQTLERRSDSTAQQGTA